MMLILVVNCQEKHENNVLSINKKSIAIIPYNEAENCYRQEKATFINDDEILGVNELLIEAIIENNKSKKTPYIDLNNYYLQYMPVLNEKDEKMIWINGFTEPNEKDWKNESVIIRGKSNGEFFTFTINLTKGDYSKITFEI